ncbi:related to Cold sensitive U2 snRNA suppressor 1 [Zygosaccharomyces bailii ISA1307]|nr:related to Cold sensitive U2 snRNA suppressor 1 [Zygosaccharomyces bailii ISA1307]
MARKCKRYSEKNGKSISNNKTELARLLDSRIARHKGLKPKLQEPSDLAKQYEPLIEKFQVRKEQEGSQVVIYRDAPEEDQNFSEAEDNKQETEISRKKLRKAAKPSLTELKQTVPFPELIQWYDCDAQFPHLLASIKTSKNIVPVPEHWQNKKEYLAGRSFLEKKPFQLPEILKETDIEQMRQTMPEAEESKDPSLKETARARVQPKLGSLDIDYKKFHDIFFKLGANWKPDYLLPFGDLFYENRNLYEEARWMKLVREKKPGKISADLRKIMNMGEGKLPPWCMKMKSLGMPPGYPTLKIAGLNCGIELIKGDMYGTLSSGKDSKDKIKYFGEMVAVEEAEAKLAEDQPHELTTESHPQPQKHNAQSIPVDTIFELNIKEPIKDSGTEPIRDLYKVLEEKTSDSATEYTGSRTVYAMSGNDQDAVIHESSQEIKKNEHQDHVKNFKF